MQPPGTCADGRWGLLGRARCAPAAAGPAAPDRLPRLTHPVLRAAASARHAGAPLRALPVSLLGARRRRPLALSPAGQGQPPTLPPTMGDASGYVPKLVSPPMRPGGGSAMVQMDPFGFTESCLMKPLMTVPLGFVMGAAFGVFMGSWEGISPPVLLPGVPMPPAKPMVEEFRATGRQMGRKARNWSRNFAVITAIFSGTECVLERIRAEDDMWNSISAGFISGAVLAIKQGPQAMLFGGAGFAAFSYVIDKVTGRH